MLSLFPGLPGFYFQLSSLSVCYGGTLPLVSPSARKMQVCWLLNCSMVCINHPLVRQIKVFGGFKVYHLLNLFFVNCQYEVNRAVTACESS